MGYYQEGSLGLVGAAWYGDRVVVRPSPCSRRRSTAFEKLLVPGADAEALDGLARGLGAAALRVARAEVPLEGVRRADERAEFVSALVLECALRGRGGAAARVGGARLGESARRGADGAVDALDRDRASLVVAAAARDVRVFVVAVLRGVIRRVVRGGGVVRLVVRLVIGRVVRARHRGGAGRERGRLRDAALVLAADHADVSLLAPRAAPRVLDLPVVFAAVGAVADREDAVVELLAAVSVKDTALVELEAGLVRLDGDRDGLAGDGLGEVVLVSRVDVGEAGDGHDGVALRLALARRARAGRVRVVILGADAAIPLDPFECIVHEAAVAAHVAVVVARDEHLLGERGELVARDDKGALEGARRGERPARSALPLVLDVRDGALGGPVDRLVGGLAVEAHVVLRAAEVRVFVGEVHLLELLEGEVGELVVANLVRVARRVVLLDELVVRGPRGGGLLLGLGRGVRLVHLRLPRVKAGHDLERAGLGRGDGDDGRGDDKGHHG